MQVDRSNTFRTSAVTGQCSTAMSIFASDQFDARPTGVAAYLSRNLLLALMLWRSWSEVYETIRRWVLADGGHPGACGGLFRPGQPNVRGPIRQLRNLNDELVCAGRRIDLPK